MTIPFWASYGLFLSVFIIVLLFVLLFDDGSFDIWKLKAVTLASSIILAMFVVPISGLITGEQTTMSDFYQSAPLIFEVLVPVSTLLILQNEISNEIKNYTRVSNPRRAKLVGFSLSCFLAIAITAIPRYITSGSFTPEFASVILSLAIVMLWFYYSAK